MNNTRGQDEKAMKAKSGNFHPVFSKPETLIKIAKIQRAFKFFIKIKKQIIKQTDNHNLKDMSTPGNSIRIGNDESKSKFNIEMKKNHFSDINHNYEYTGPKNSAGQKEGFGIQKWLDGAVYNGLFKSNRANGYGIFKHNDGDNYNGQFINDRAYGYGIYKHYNGANYEGYWVDDCQSGLGEENWSDSSNYRGCYQGGKKQGLGKIN